MAENLEELRAALVAALPSGAVLDSSVARNAEVVLRVARGQLVESMLALRDKCGFEQLMDIAGTDWPEKPERFELVYNLLSLAHNRRVTVIDSASATTPVQIVHGVWVAASWYVREAWDRYCVVFSNQPDLRRILTDYGFEGHPLRKDFPLTGYVQVRYDEERKAVVYEPVSLTQDFRSFDFESPWEAMTTLPGDEKVHLNRIEGPKP